MRILRHHQGRGPQQNQDRLETQVQTTGLDDQPAPDLQTEPLEDRRRGLDEEHGQVKSDAQRDLEERRRRPRLLDERVWETPGATEVGKQADHDQRVAEKSGQERRSHDRAVLLHPKQENRRGNHESARCEGDPGHDVEPDPQPPWVGVREVGGRGETGRESDGEDDRTTDKGAYAGLLPEYQPNPDWPQYRLQQQHQPHFGCRNIFRSQIHQRGTHRQHINPHNQQVPNIGLCHRKRLRQWQDYQCSEQTTGGNNR